MVDEFGEALLLDQVKYWIDVVAGAIANLWMELSAYDKHNAELALDENSKPSKIKLFNGCGRNNLLVCWSTIRASTNLIWYGNSRVGG